MLFSFAQKKKLEKSQKEVDDANQNILWAPPFFVNFFNALLPEWEIHKNLSKIYPLLNTKKTWNKE